MASCAVCYCPCARSWLGGGEHPQRELGLGMGRVERGVVELSVIVVAPSPDGHKAPGSR